MSSKTLNTTLAALLLSGLAAVHADKQDLQARMGFGGQHDLGNGFRFDIATEQRAFNSLRTYYQAEYDVGVNYKVNDWLAVAPLMRLGHSRKAGSKEWNQEYRPMLNVTLSQKLAGWTFEDRNRFEFRHYDNAAGKPDVWRYRNRLKVTSPWKFTSLNINPYASVELMQDMEGSNTALQSYEAAIGVNAKITDATSLELYYMAEFKETADTYNNAPHTANILGASIKVKF
ncbi:MAG: DUF2490 domain-containing protein [Kiritimatiellaeota bacterium]|nr:DUF2490 domain-containing protein [Kiritimatiellota bacterium]